MKESQYTQGIILIDRSMAGSPSASAAAVEAMSLSAASTSTDRDRIPFPEQQLFLNDLNPFPKSVFSYNCFLASVLCMWILYLLLPRGFRKQYCRANRKRYSRRIDEQMPAAGYWMPVRSMQAQGQSSVKQQRRQVHNIPVTINTNNLSSTRRSPPSQDRYNRSHSPQHPALKRIPPNKIISSTMERLKNRGIRLVAHGVHCQPKRVWISLREDTYETGGGDGDGTGNGRGEPCVTWQVSVDYSFLTHGLVWNIFFKLTRWWNFATDISRHTQTEFPRRVPDQTGQVSIVMMRGSLHTILLKNILYIDVGKKTHALQLSNDLPDSTCLSLLTQNGSLDLEANSKLERDSLVSCFSMILDDIHEEDWRALYEATPEPSLVSSAASNSFNSNGRFNSANKKGRDKDMMLQLL